MSERTRHRPLIVVALLAALLVGIPSADWWTCLPDDTVAEFVGGHRCMQCHQKESRLWQGSHHDLAMDVATPDTVLGDFNDATLEHFGITSRMYRDGDRYFITTEGPDGQLADFEVKYVFGVEPLQQYMVEFNRPGDMPESEVGRLQVLRISWDTERKKWFYLSPPDVAERLLPDDPMHWTGVAQNWNHMCAECHSTNLQKNYDLASATYHTTFSDMDVSCEACHGPGSVHVELASAKSLFWDRKLGYGLAQLKSKSSEPQIQACAPCHSRRNIVAPNYRGGEKYYDHYANSLLEPQLYYCDGQVRDEVYVYGSYIQSKMYKNGIRCTDCHDPHTTKVKFPDNKLCTSCHTHEAAKYDTPAHHRHGIGSTGASCVECHMPETPYMEVDLRRDHSLRVPRPDLSVELGTPNACTGCHLESKNVAADKREELQYYADWLQAARDGDIEVRDEIARVDRWAAEQVRKWYGEPKPDKDHVEFAAVLNEGWRLELNAHKALASLARNRRAAGIVRASALSRLAWYPPAQRTAVSMELLDNSDPQIRAAAVQNLSELPRRELLETLSPLLDDPIRYVRIQAALALASIPDGAFMAPQRELRAKSLEEYRASLMVNSDLATSHMALGVLAERQGDVAAAAKAYRTAIRVQGDVTGPRANLAAVLERQGNVAEAEKLRAEELQLLARDAKLAPQSAAVQYRYGLALYLAGREEEAEAALAVAYKLEPNTADYCLTLALLYEKQRRFDEALPLAERALQLHPSELNGNLVRKIRAAAQGKDSL